MSDTRRVPMLAKFARREKRVGLPEQCSSSAWRTIDSRRLRPWTFGLEALKTWLEVCGNLVEMTATPRQIQAMSTVARTRRPMER